MAAQEAVQYLVSEKNAAYDSGRGFIFSFFIFRTFMLETVGCEESGKEAVFVLVRRRREGMTATWVLIMEGLGLTHPGMLRGMLCAARLTGLSTSNQLRRSSKKSESRIATTTFPPSPPPPSPAPPLPSLSLSPPLRHSLRTTDDSLKTHQTFIPLNTKPGL